MIDLDDLARKATAAATEDDTGEWYEDPKHNDWDLEHFPLAKEHIAANSPDVTLKLVGRIRELEEALKACAWKLHGEDIDPDGKESDVFLAIARKGIP